MPGCIPRGSPLAGHGECRSRVPPGAPRVSRRDKGGPRERAETNVLRWRRRQETLETTTRPMVRAHRSGSRSATDVFVGIGTDDEPSLGVTRDRNGLTLQGAQRGGRSQDNEALPVRDDGVGARWAGAFGRLDATPEIVRYAREER